MIKNWKTTAAFFMSAVCETIARQWPDHAGWAVPMSQVFIALGGYMAADAKHDRA